MRALSIVGARPQFMKLAPLSRAFAEAGLEHTILHTGQHYDHSMSDVFFEELRIPKPDINLAVGSGSHGAQTAQMLEGVENVLLNENIDCVVVYGDTNSTVAGALAAVKLHIPVAHVEAGLRSFNRAMPEEINRIATDHVSDVLLAPTQTAMGHLANEGLAPRSHFTGDVMLDTVLFNRELAVSSSILQKLNAPTQSGYALATVHRAENTDSTERLLGILRGLEKVAVNTPVFFPIHPRTRKCISDLEFSFKSDSNVRLIDPLGYLDLLELAASAQLILTDSGGLQKEAYFLEVPCVTMRDETEWTETIESGSNVLAGAAAEKIASCAEEMVGKKVSYDPVHFGAGNAAELIADCVAKLQKRS